MAMSRENTRGRRNEDRFITGNRADVPLASSLPYDSSFAIFVAYRNDSTVCHYSNSGAVPDSR
jgi:hypothetical protein